MNEKVCTLVFLRTEDQILLAMKKRGFGKGHYNGPGGKIEAGETVEQAMIRECQEEIGVTPTRFWKVAELDFLQSGTEEPWHIYGHIFVCDQWQGEPAETDEMAPEWFSIDTIPYKTMWQDDELWLPHVLDGKKVYGQFTFNADDRMVTHHIELVKDLPGIIPNTQR